MTEESAKKKWCPQVRSVIAEAMDEVETKVMHGSTSFNRVFKDGNINITANLCFGSDCMMWRAIFTEGYNDGLEVVPGHYHEGYCGLAGKP